MGVRRGGPTRARSTSIPPTCRLATARRPPIPPPTWRRCSTRAWASARWWWSTSARAPASSAGQRPMAAHCREVVAVDISPPMLHVARSRFDALGLSNVRCVPAGFLTYEHDGPAPTAVYSRNALHHLPDAWKAIALARVARLLGPGGVLRLRDLVYSFDGATRPTCWNVGSRASNTSAAAGRGRSSRSTCARSTACSRGCARSRCSRAVGSRSAAKSTLASQTYASTRASGCEPLSRTATIRVVKLPDGVEWGVHVCTLLAVFPPDAALPCGPAC